MAQHTFRDRITKIRIKGFRCLEDVELSLGGLTVLIGDNGAGKSSIVEALETLRYFAEPGASVPEWLRQHPVPVHGHGGATELRVEVESDADQPRLVYEFGLGENSGVGFENLEVGPTAKENRPLYAIKRRANKAKVFDQRSRQLQDVEADPSRLLLSVFGSLPPPGATRVVEQVAIDRAAEVLRNIEVHVPFEVMPAWAAR